MARAQRGLRSLSDREVEELGRLYRAATTHLALERSFGASVRRREELNRIVGRAHGVIYGRPRQGRNWAQLLGTFLSLPGAVRRTGRYHAFSALLLFAGIAYGFVGAARDPEWALAFVAPGDPRTPYATRAELRASLLAGRPREGLDLDPETAAAHQELDAGEKAGFAAFLWQNNTRVALMAFFSGFLGGVPTTLLLLVNGALLGVYTHTFHQADLAYEWWAWILPHGVTELGAIVLLGGGGLFLGHTLIAPGERSRADALRAVRGDVLRLAVLAFPMLFLAALFESFVRQSGLSDPARYGFAALTAVLWGIYFCWVRAPAGVQRLGAPQTLAERAVPLPDAHEIVGHG